MNKIPTTHPLLLFFALLVQLGVSIPVFAADSTSPPSFECCSGDVCDKNENLWTKVMEDVSYCKGYCKGAGCGSVTTWCSKVDYPDYKWVLRQEEDDKHNPKPYSYTLYAGPGSSETAQRVTGIECNKIREGSWPNYWVAAWTAAENNHVSKYPDNRNIGLAINSKVSRDRNQLHIHVSCIDKYVHDDLENTANQQQIAQTPEKWKGSSLSLNNHDYHVLILKDATTPVYKDTGGKYHNLFELVWEYVLDKTGSEMENQNLVVAKRQEGGFYILNGTDPKPAGESLLNEECKNW